MPLIVRRVGIELEGGWDRRPACVADRSVRFRGDGSVSVGGSVHSGEVASLPIKPAEVPAFIADAYPDRVGDSCGLHVHLSFSDEIDRDDWAEPNAVALSWLADSNRFGRFLRARLGAWGRRYPCRSKPFWSRLRGENHYCQDAFNGNEAFAGRGNRYCAVNFLAYREHSTVEIRVLPMFKERSTAIAAIVEVIATAESYLVLAQSRGALSVEMEPIAQDSSPIVEVFDVALPLRTMRRELV